MLTPAQIKDAAVAALEDVKGFDIVVLDVQKMTSLTNFMVICSGNSNRQTRALANNVIDQLKEKGVEARGLEGENEGEWVLVDLDDVIVHVMLPPTRAYYNLEQLWAAPAAAKAA